MAFDEWKPKRDGHVTCETIESAYMKWATMKLSASLLAKCAKSLVRRRRLRAWDNPKWDRYACGAYYDCCSAPGSSGKRWENRDEFATHLHKDHKKTPNQIENEINSRRKIWQYRGTTLGVEKDMRHSYYIRL